MKKTKVDSDGSHFKILREIVIELQTKQHRNLGSTRPKRIKAILDRASKELQEICPHKNVAELMSSWSPKKTPKAKFIFSSGRVCLDCGLKELASETKGHFYRVLPEPSFFANFSNLSKLEKLLESPMESNLVFRKLDDLLEENSKKEDAVAKS